MKYLGAGIAIAPHWHPFITVPSSTSLLTVFFWLLKELLLSTPAVPWLLWQRKGVLWSEREAGELWAKGLPSP